MRTRCCVAAWMLASLWGCGEASTVEDVAPPRLDEQIFRERVQPVLLARCSNPTTCHGVAGRPLSLYAPRAHRRDSADVFRDPPLTEWEVRANYDRARSFTVDWGHGPELLTKPLAEEVGGVAHRGGATFWSMDDREFRALSTWIEGGADEP